jgi:stage II sporulation protein D
MGKNILSTVALISMGVFAFFLFFLYPPSKPVFQPDGKPIMLRVRIARSVSSAKISFSGLCDVVNPSTGEIIVKGIGIAKGREFRVLGGKIQFGNKSLGDKAIRISSEEKGGFTFNGTEYRGELDLTVTSGGLRAVNFVELDDYLKGVIPREVYSFWPMSALKAQAVASRSYAVFEAYRRKNLAYDLTSDTFTQVYGGRSAERARTTKAVESTRGEVLKYKGELIPGYFHASCGGRTTSVSKVWGGPDSEPFQGVRSPYCRWSPFFRWRARVPTTLLLDKLKESGYSLERIDDIKIGGVDSSGRVEYVRVRAGNQWFEISIKGFMNAVGAVNLKSSNFRVRKYPLFYDFYGYGWGHGIGMCQWCAFGLSLRRWDYKRILEFFYPGAEVSYLSDLP